jgi:hypothetical protein
MTVPKHLEEAVSRLTEASPRIERIRARPSSSSKVAEWLEALSDFALAQSDIQTFNNESIHEKLHQLADALHLTFK